MGGIYEGSSIELRGSRGGGMLGGRRGIGGESEGLEGRKVLRERRGGGGDRRMLEVLLLKGKG